MGDSRVFAERSTLARWTVRALFFRIGSQSKLLFSSYFFFYFRFNRRGDELTVVPSSSMIRLNSMGKLNAILRARIRCSFSLRAMSNMLLAKHHDRTFAGFLIPLVLVIRTRNFDEIEDRRVSSEPRSAR